MNPKISLHPAILDWQSDLRRGKMSRREFLRLATLLGASATSAAWLAGCNPQIVNPQPAPLPLPQRGGTIRIGTAVQPIDHPARLSWIEASNQVRQVAEYLTETGPDNLTRPWLLDRWEADEAVKTWTLYLREGITFNTGAPLTADDVIFSFAQWLDPEVGSSMAGLLAYLDLNGIEKVDDLTLRLHLNEAQIGVPEHLFHYPAVILPRDFEGDFIKQPVGTGPFSLVEYVERERAVFKRRPDYWRLGADARPLPYLDGLIYLDLEPKARLVAMQGGAIDTLFIPRPADWQALRNAPGLQIQDTSTAETFVLRMRVDEAPWNDVRVRQALKLCQDRAKILEISYSDQGDLAIDAHVAPPHPAYCPKPIPAYDPERSRALLAEAGYPDGLKVKLTTKNDLGEPKIVRLLQKLALEGGFDIELNIVEPARYWSQWTEVNLGLTVWGHRPLDTMVLALGYTADAQGQPVAWNETHWIDEEFIALLRQAERTLDVEARRQIMCQIEDVMQERGPIGISYWRKVWNITRSEFQSVKAHPAGYDLFYEVWKRIDEA
jgi:peptide/nickel transport system substrate-binding protein